MLGPRANQRLVIISISIFDHVWTRPKGPQRAVETE